MTAHAHPAADPHAAILRMANQIAVAFAAEADPVAATAEHIASFWDPRMRAQLRSALAENEAGLDPVAREAARRVDGHP